ncbi:MAG: NAD(P)-dependent oxidoreductase [Actinomycetes bacterium]
MARILLTQRLVPGGADLLEASGHEIEFVRRTSPMSHQDLVAKASDVDAIVCLLNDLIDEAVLASSSRLRVVGTVAVGFDNIDLDAAARRGVAVVNTPGVLDAATSETTLLLILAALRRSSSAELDLRAGRWSGWGIEQHMGLDLGGSIVGLVGYGRIAQAVAARVQAFGASVIHHTRHPTGVAGWTESLDELLERCDVLSIHVPLSPSTRGLIGPMEIQRMKPTAVVVNTARGPILDEVAVADALEAGRLWGAGFDVFDGEPTVNPRLLAAPNTVLLPHVGSATIRTRREMCDVAIQGVLDVLEGKTPPNLVNA